MRYTARKAGVLGEATAARFLQEQGVRILQKNFRCPYGEIDLIGWDGSYYLIVEVKARGSSRQGRPAEAVDYRKQYRICQALNYYRMKRGLDDYTPVRFDVVEIDSGGRCHWIRNAFEYIE